MDIRAEEITKIIREQLGGFSAGVDVSEVGTVLSLGDGIARIHGLERCMAGELLELPHGVMGIALNLEEDSVGAVLMGEYAEIKEVESNEEERGHPPVVTFGDLLRLFGSTHASDARQRRGPPALPPDRLFLLCGHLVC